MVEAKEPVFLPSGAGGDQTRATLKACIEKQAALSSTLNALPLSECVENRQLFTDMIANDMF